MFLSLNHKLDPPPPLKIVTSLLSQDYNERRKETGAATENKYKVDAAPPLVKFEAGEDNRNDLTHAARYQPRPICSEEELWINVPFKIEHIYKNIDLNICGADSQVSERTIGIMHDRTVPLQLKYFHRKNATVTWQPLIEERRRSQNDKISSVYDYDWSDIENMSLISDALINYSLIQIMLFPYDLTGLCLLKVYNLYGYLPYGSEKERARMISEHFYRVSCANISRAARGRPPLDFEGLEAVLKKVLSDESLPREPPSRGAQADRRALDNLTSNLQEYHGRDKNAVRFQTKQVPNRGRGGGGASKSGGGGGGARATPAGKPICFNFNDGQCMRAKTQSGCAGAKGKEFLHVCNAWSKTSNSLCMLPHAKWAHI